MYRVASRITPQQLRAVAAQLYVELLCGGYTQVCEFQYLHHDETGGEYGDAATLSWALADAAVDVGIGLTILPVLYERAGFMQPALRDYLKTLREQSYVVIKPAYVEAAGGAGNSEIQEVSATPEQEKAKKGDKGSRKWYFPLKHSKPS